MITDDEVKNRLENIAGYNAHFQRAKDEKGRSLAGHVVGPRLLCRIMLKEWGVDPRKFGIADPGPAVRPGRKPVEAAAMADAGW